jgi:hypothetical protein
MPHYKDGTPARVGDLILKEEAHASSMLVVGILAQITPGSTTCNGQVLPIAQKAKTGGTWLPMATGNLWSVTLSDCAKIPESVGMLSTAVEAEEKLAPVGAGG